MSDLGKVKRIKQAREEAAAEIEAYRNERERQFREYEARYMGSREDVAAKIDKDTEQLLKNLDKSVKDNKDNVRLDKFPFLKFLNKPVVFFFDGYQIELT